MNKTWLIVIGVMALSIAASFYRGNKLLAKRKGILREVSDNIDPDELIFLTYHGGIPEMPKPQKLNLGLSDKYLLFFNDKGEREKVLYGECRKAEKIVTRHDPDMRGKSVFLLGPFAGFFFKPKFRYYIVIEYTDSTHQDNYILLECDQKAHIPVYERIKKNIPKVMAGMQAAIY